MKNMLIAISVILALCAAAYGCMLRHEQAEKQKIADAGAFIAIFHYITMNEDKEFDYRAVAQALNLSEDELVSYLSALERAGKIKVTSRYLARKPIVITHSDRMWYFHRVTLPHTEVPAPPMLPR